MYKMSSSLPVVAAAATAAAMAAPQSFHLRRSEWRQSCQREPSDESDELRRRRGLGACVQTTLDDRRPDRRLGPDWWRAANQLAVSGRPPLFWAAIRQRIDNKGRQQPPRLARSRCRIAPEEQKAL